MSQPGSPIGPSYSYATADLCDTHLENPVDVVAESKIAVMQPGLLRWVVPELLGLPPTVPFPVRCFLSACLTGYCKWGNEFIVQPGSVGSMYMLRCMGVLLVSCRARRRCAMRLSVNRLPTLSCRSSRRVPFQFSQQHLREPCRDFGGRRSFHGPAATVKCQVCRQHRRRRSSSTAGARQLAARATHPPSNAACC